MNTFLFNAVMVILLTTELGHNFPIINQKLPSTYDVKECPPGFLPCVSQNEEHTPDQVGVTPSGALATIATSASSVEASTPTALPSNATEQQKTPKAPSGGNMAETGDSKTKSLQTSGFECPPGVWVC